jgi:hypothetical protein
MPIRADGLSKYSYYSPHARTDRKTLHAKHPARPMGRTQHRAEGVFTWRGGCRRDAWRVPGTSRRWGAARRTACSSPWHPCSRPPRASRRTQQLVPPLRVAAPASPPSTSPPDLNPTRSNKQTDGENRVKSEGIRSGRVARKAPRIRGKGRG